MIKSINISISWINICVFNSVEIPYFNYWKYITGFNHELQQILIRNNFFGFFLYLLLSSNKPLTDFFIATFSSGFGALAAFYFNIYQANQELKKRNISSLKKAEYILAKHYTNNKIINDFVKKVSKESPGSINDWDKIGIIDNKFPILEIDVQSLLFLIDFNHEFGFYYFSTFGIDIDSELRNIHHIYAYIITQSKQLFLLDKSKSKYFQIVISKDKFNNLTSELDIKDSSSYNLPACIFERITYEQQQLIIGNTGYTHNLLDKILLAHSENEEIMNIIDIRNNKYSIYIEKTQNKTYKSQQELIGILTPKLYSELEKYTRMLIETNNSVIYDCMNASVAIGEFLETY